MLKKTVRVILALLIGWLYLNYFSESFDQISANFADNPPKISEGFFDPSSMENNNLFPP
ncbi:MAG: hypothetical protein WC227_03580 [Patescibacteria group bacterium]|jgi:hypothetical protein